MNKLLFLFLFPLCFLFSACAKKEGCTDSKACNFDSEAKKDNGTCIFVPEGMATSFVTSNIDFDTGQLGGLCGGVGVKADLNFSPFNFAICTNAQGIVDVGEVTCLGEVTTHPSGTMLTSAAAVVNHGYVVKLDDNSLVRFVCAGWQTNTSGAVTGVKIEWQHGF
jgi:hypothetical protein